MVLVFDEANLYLKGIIMKRKRKALVVFKLLAGKKRTKSHKAEMNNKIR